MFVNAERDEQFSGYNPAFVRRVQEKRRNAVVQREKAAVDVRRELNRIRLEEYRAKQAAEIEAAAERRKKAILTTRTVRDIIADVAHSHHLTTADILGPSRFRKVVRARMEAMAVVRQMKPHLSLPQIGKLFGNRDHTTVIHALRKLGVPTVIHKESS